MTTERYDIVTRILHWLIVAAVGVQYLSVLALPEDAASSSETLVSFHMSFGLFILSLMLVRLLWRLIAVVPAPVAGMPDWQTTLSLWTHRALYALLIAMPLVGWLWVSARGWDITLFGVIYVPALIQQSASLSATFGGLHELLSVPIILLVGLHGAAALYHWLIVKDEVMHRMWLI